MSQSSPHAHALGWPWSRFGVYYIWGLLCVQTHSQSRVQAHRILKYHRKVCCKKAAGWTDSIKINFRVLLYLWSVIPYNDGGIEERLLWLLPSLFPLKFCSSSHTPLEKMPCVHASCKQPRKLYFVNNWKINCLLTSKTAWCEIWFVFF